MRKNGRSRTRLVVAVALLLFPLLPVSALSGAVPHESAGQAEAQTGAAFPLEAGTYWVYQAVVRWGSVNSSAPQEKLMEWKMEVDRVIHRGNIQAAVIKGFPRDLDGSHGQTTPAESLIVESGGTKFYWIPPASFQDSLARLENPKDSLDGLVSDNEIFLDFPLTERKKFCDMTGMIRTDGFYCWVVGEPKVAELSGAKGIPPDATTAIPVQFLTAGDATSFDFVPGVGITRYRYQRHGTALDTELQLVEFHPGSR